MFLKELNELFETDINSFHKQLNFIALNNNFKIYLVGGAVRDKILGIEPKDHDYVAIGIDLEDLASVLNKNLKGSKIKEVGKSFGILKMEFAGDEYDFALPRIDINRENVTFNKNINIKKDLERRDFVINAGAWDLSTEFNENNIISPEGYNVVSDIKNKIIRTVGNPLDRFSEDPLRQLRCIQFSTRFGFDIENSTLEAIQKNVDLLKKVSGERFYDEFYKGWTKGTKDTARFFELLEKSGIGRLMFGETFEPIPLKPSENDFFRKQYVAAFLKGGNFAAMNKKVEDHKLIEVARLFYDFFKSNRPVTEKDIRMLSNQSQLFDFLIETFYSISENLGEWLQNFLSKPIIPKKEGEGTAKPYELPITGGQLIELSKSIGKELKGKSISDAVNGLIMAYRTGKIDQKANQTPEQTIEIIKSWLSNTILKESWYSDNNRADIMKHRISNILYK